MQELEMLKREVDIKLDKINTREYQQKDKEMERKRKEKPLEDILRLKEKEIKNTITLLHIIKKDYETLENNYIDTDLQRFTDLENKLAEETSRGVKLESQVKMLNKLNEEHKRCETQREEFNKEKKLIQNELQFLKDKNNDLQLKMRSGEVKKKEVKESRFHTKKVLEARKLPDINQNNPGKGPTTRESSKVNKARSPQMIANSSKDLLNQKKQFSVSVQNKNFNLNPEPAERIEVFTDEQKPKVLTVMSQSEYDAVEKKFTALSQGKFIIEKKGKTECKQLNKRLEDLGERLEYIQLMNKEAEQKNKIFALQINEYRNDNRTLQKKILDAQVNVEKLGQSIQDKDKENRSLTEKLQVYQKKDISSSGLDVDKYNYNEEGGVNGSEASIEDNKIE
jgi:hypothetical protein